MSQHSAWLNTLAVYDLDDLQKDFFPFYDFPSIDFHRDITNASVTVYLADVRSSWVDAFVIADSKMNSPQSPLFFHPSKAGFMASANSQLTDDVCVFVCSLERLSEVVGFFPSADLYNPSALHNPLYWIVYRGFGI